MWDAGLAQRFAETYMKYPAGYSHALVISCNDPNWESYKHVFNGIPCIFTDSDNFGWDIGAFQLAAHTIDCDLMMFFGSSAYLTGEGWMNRVVKSTEKYGFGIYGSMASGGDPPIGVYPHIRTTGFWMNPSLLKSYPYLVEGNKLSRYAFEHGPHNITNWSIENGGVAMSVTWIGEYEIDKWAVAKNAFRNGDQSAVIVRDKLCDPPFWPIR